MAGSTSNSKLKLAFSTIFITLITGTAAVWLWATSPIRVNYEAVDPAVTLANKLAKPGPMYREGYAGPTDKKLHYVAAGQGDPIIFLHGFPSYWFTMFNLMEEFKNEHQVIAVDGLGVGRSDAPSSVQDYKLENMIGSLSGLIDELNLENVHLVGHDWGTAIAVAYAQAFPENVKTVSVMSALPHNVIVARLEHDKSHQELFSYAKEFSKANPALIKLLGIKNKIWADVYSQYEQNGFLGEEQANRLRGDIGNAKRLNKFINWYRANFPDPEEITNSSYWPSKESRLETPALFIYGTDDPVVTEALVKDFKNLSDSLEVIKLSGVGHRPHFEKQAIVVERIQELINSVSGEFRLNE